jgi:hypothetical protein
MRFCCREITIDGSELRVYPSGSIWRFHQQQQKWTLAKKTSANSTGYLDIKINNKKILRHRIIAHAYFGFDLSSPLMIDHRDRNPKNNAVWNLRIVSFTENKWNNSCKGVIQDIYKDRIYYTACIRINGKKKHKNFKTEEEALTWRNEMKALHYKITEPDYKHIMSQCLRNI